VPLARGGRGGRIKGREGEALGGINEEENAFFTFSREGGGERDGGASTRGRGRRKEGKGGPLRLLIPSYSRKEKEKRKRGGFHPHVSSGKKEKDVASEGGERGKRSSYIFPRFTREREGGKRRTLAASRHFSAARGRKGEKKGSS